jgi:hypothetical protein
MGVLVVREPIRPFFYFMGTFIDLTGKTFGNLFVIKVHKNRKRNGKTLIRWHCACGCGKNTIVPGADLKNGHTRSCGCLHKEVLLKMITTHGQKGTPEYFIWQAMKGRCLRKKHTSYKNYGGREITISPRWINSFENFISDMGPRPTKKHTLERVENNGNYGPDNCVWDIRKVQSRNQRSNRWIKFDGKKMVLVDWASYFKIKPSTLSHHLKTKTIGQTHEFYKNKGSIE